MGKDTTIKDIAEAAGVSHSTVSRVFNNNPRISQETKDRIRQIASDMGYSVNYVARSLVRKRSDLIGLVLTSINDPFMSEHVQEIEQRARDFGYNIILCNTNENADRENNAYNLLRDRQVDGIIFFPVNSNSILNISQLNKDEIPLIFLNDKAPSDPGSHVSVDNYAGGRMAFEYLYGLGHRDILYVTSNPRRNANIRRKDGFCDACMEKNLSVNLFDVLADEPAINLMADSALGNLSQSYAIGRTFFEKGFHKRFTAVLAGSDLVAIGILQAAHEYNVKVPEELSVMGYDDISFSGLPGINLTTIRQPIKDIADICVTELVSAIKEERKVAVNRRIMPTLVVRNSCRAI